MKSLGIESRLAKDEIVEALKLLHTNIVGQLDDAAFSSALGKVCAVAIDGAFTGPKSVAFLQSVCPKLRIRWRDAAHAIRRAVAVSVIF